MTFPELVQLAALVLNALLIPVAVLLSRMDKSLALNSYALGRLTAEFERHIATDERTLSAIHRRLDRLHVPAADAE